MSEDNTVTRLLMHRQRIDDMRVHSSAEGLDAKPGEVVFRLDLFSLTTNNITYAAFGEAMSYWAFFPVDQPDRGQLPVWGYADVIDSGVPDIGAGQRYFGYFPAATHLRVRPGKQSRHSFRDDSEHRKALPEIYNWYQRTDRNPFHDASSEPLHAIYRPLFVTAFCLADFLHDQAFFDARRVLLSSASSKTGYATAFCLQDHNELEIVGLTSPGNHQFVERTGLYHQVVNYADLENLDAEPATLYIDIAGNQDLRKAIHRHLGASLVHDCTVGSAQSIEPPVRIADLPGPKPEFFFAPVQIAKRHQDWGVAEFDQRVGKATTEFYDLITRPDDKLLTIAEHRGLEAAEKIIADMLRGDLDPGEGHIVRL